MEAKGCVIRYYGRPAAGRWKIAFVTGDGWSKQERKTNKYAEKENLRKMGIAHYYFVWSFPIPVTVRVLFIHWSVSTLDFLFKE